MFRRGLEVDPRFTGAARRPRPHPHQARADPEARRELQAALDEKARQSADWTLKDAPEARALLASLAGRS